MAHDNQAAPAATKARIGMPAVRRFGVVLTSVAVWCAVLFAAAGTIAEDRTLQRELAGYSDYARTNRWRLLPGLW